MRVGLVLGAGGVLGGAWLTGALYALATETGWDPAEAERIIGTSAGSMVGALLASGVPPWFMVAHSRGETFEGLTGVDGRPASEADRSAGAAFRPARGALPWWPGSLPLALRTAVRPMRFPPAAVAAGWLPRGIVSNDPLRDTIRRVAPSGWAPHHGLRIIACDYATGRRVRFGAPDAPEAELADAVAASCSIPGFYRPVRIGGRLYVDGGMWSTSNLDLLRTEDLDLIICLNPTSSLHPLHSWDPAERIAQFMRNASGRRLGSETRKLRAAGHRVVLIQPTREDLLVIGPNLMSRRRRNEVIDTAIRTTTAQLHAAAADLEGLPPGRLEKIRRPEGDPSSWPPLFELQDEIAAA
jgi:NTE family protein